MWCRPVWRWLSGLLLGGSVIGCATTPPAQDGLVLAMRQDDSGGGNLEDDSPDPPKPLEVESAVTYGVAPVEQSEKDFAKFPNFEVLSGVLGTEAQQAKAGNPRTFVVAPAWRTMAPAFIYVVGHRGRVETQDIIVYAEATTFAVWQDTPKLYHVFHYGHNHNLEPSAPSQSVVIVLKHPAIPGVNRFVIDQAAFVDVVVDQNGKTSFKLRRDKTQPPDPNGQHPTTLPSFREELVGADEWVFNGFQLPEEQPQWQRLITIERTRRLAGLPVSKR